MCKFLTLLIISFTPFFLLAQASFDLVPLPARASAALDEQFVAYELVSAPTADMHRFLQAAASEERALHMVLGSGTDFDLLLRAKDVRAPGYQLVIAGPEGREVRPRSVNKTYQGHRVGQPSDVSALTVSKDFLYGFVRKGEETYFIEPAWLLDTTLSLGTYVWYKASELRDKGELGCELHEHDEAPKKGKAFGPMQPGARVMQECYEVGTALAADFQLYSALGSSVTATEDFMVGVLNNVNTNYDDEFNNEILFAVNGFFISTCASCDPWTSSTNAGTLLNSFTNWGNSGGFGFDYSVATLWTNRNFNGGTIGVAWLSGVCGSNRYNCCQRFSSNAALLRVLQAHEFGHNLSAQHDAPSSNTIMAPSVNTSTQWSNASQNSINNFVNILSNIPGCLGDCGGFGFPPTAQINASTDEICAGQSVQFQDLSTDNPTEWDWSFPGGTPATASVPNPVVTYLAPGFYTAELTVSNAFGASTDFYDVEVKGAPDALFLYDENGLTASFTNLSGDYNNVSWFFGDGGVSEEDDPVYTYDEPGVYTVNMVVTNDCGSNVHTETLVMVEFPQASFVSDVQGDCAPVVVQFTNTSTNDLGTYNWNFPGGTPSSSTEEEPVVTYDEPGTYEATLVAINPAGSDATTQTITISAAGATSDFTVENASGSLTVELEAQANASDNLNWDFGDGNSSTDASVTHTYDEPGEYSVTLIVSNDCGSDTSVQDITVFLQPLANISISSAAGCEPLVLSPANAAATANNGEAYLWSATGSEEESSTEATPSFTYPLAGTYELILEVSNAAGTALDTLLVNVGAGPMAAFDAQTDLGSTDLSLTDNSQSADSYLWDFGDGNTSTEANPAHSYAEDGTYTVQLIVTNDCGSDTTEQEVTVVTAPSAGFSLSGTAGCAPFTVEVANSASGNTTDWAYTADGATPATATGESPSFTYDSPGTYLIVQTVSNAAGSSSDTLEVQISAGPTAAFDAQTALGSTDLSLTDNSTAADSYLWDFGDGNTSTKADPSHSYAEDGTYTVQLIVTNDCGSDTTEQEVAVVTAPSAGFSLSGTAGCAPFTVEVANSASGNTTDWAYTADGATPATATGESPSFTYASPGTYLIVQTVSNAAGSSSDTLEVQISAGPTAAFDAQTALGSTDLSLTDNSQDADSYLWDFGDGNTSTEADPAHSYAGDGTYTVQLTVTNDCGSDTTEQEVTVVTAPSAGFSLSGTAGCAPFTVEVTNSASGNTTDWAYTADGATPATATGESPSFTYDSPGTYLIVQTVSNAAGSSSDTLEVQISAGPTAAFDAQTALGSTDLSLTDNSTAADSYLWDFGDGNTSTEANPAHSYAEDGTYTVQLIVTNDCGSDTTEQEVTVVTAPSAGFSLSGTAGCAPFTVEVANSASGNTTDWAYTADGATPATATGESPSFTYASPGTYLIVQTVSNAAGSSSDTLEIQVSAGPTAAFDAQTDLGSTDLSLTDNSQDAASYQWDFGDGNTSTEANPAHSYAEDGTYTVQLIVTNDCGSDTTEQEVTVVTAPSAGFSLSGTAGCAPFTVEVANSASGNTTDWAYTADGATPATATGESPSFTYASPGTYLIVQTVSNAAGSSSDTLEVQISAGPTAAFDAQTALGSTDLSLTDNSTAADSYLWDFGDGNTSTEADPAHSYAEDGTYTVQLIVTNDCGSDTTEQEVTVVTAPSAGFSLSGTAGCAPFTVEVANSASGNTTDWAYTAEGATPATATGETPSFTYDSPGTYLIVQTVSNAAGSSSDTLEVQISAGPTAAFDAQTDLGSTDLSLTDNSQGADSYLWDFGDGNTSTEADPAHSYAEDGTYTVKLMVTNDCGSDTFEQEVTVVTAPSAGFKVSSDKGCAPFTVEVINVASENTTTWLYTAPGAVPATSNEQGPIFVYDTPGTYLIVQEVSNAAGTSLDTLEIEVQAGPTAAFTAAADLGSAVLQLTDDSQNADTYFWDFGDGTTSEEATPEHTYAADGSYTVQLIVANTCGSDTATQTVEVLTPPAASFTLSSSVGCAPFTVEVSNSASGNTTEWSYTAPGAMPETASGANPTFVYEQPGTYTITQEVSNAAGSSISTLEVVVQAGPMAVFTAQADLGSASLLLTDNSEGADSYSWDFGDGTTSEEATPEHTYAADGTYTVQLIVANSCGSDTATQVVEIMTPPSAGFLLSDSIGCAPFTVEVSNEASENTAEWSYTAPGATPEMASGPNPVFVYTEPGSYTITQEVSNAAGSNITTLEIEVLEAPEAAYTFEVEGETVAFTNTSTGSFLSFLWEFGDGEQSEEASPTHSYPGNGIYTATLIAYNECDTVSLSQSFEIIVSSTANEQWASRFEVFPNPSNGQVSVWIEAEPARELELQLYSVVGQPLRRLTTDFHAGRWQQQMDWQGLPAGVYVLELRVGEQRAYRRLVIK